MRFWAVLSIIVAFGTANFTSLALVDANSAANTSAPADGAPWDNVVGVNGASAVYLGGAWVLTASHVGYGSFAVGSSTFSPDGTTLRLTNSDGSGTDLILFHLTIAPPLPSIPLVSTTPAAFSQIDMIGFGHIAGSAQTNFGLYSGFYWSFGATRSWGNNKVNLGGTSVINAGSGNVTAFNCDFTSPGTLGPAAQTSDEAQVSVGDSGGGVFQKSGSVWQLVGILDAEMTQVNQQPNTSVYGDKTYMADIATYQSQITAVLAAQPVPNLSISWSGDSALVSWPDTGVNYNLQGAASPTGSSWLAVSQTRLAANGMLYVSVPMSTGYRFFRLQKPGST